ncbi:hypothetical protein DBR42_00660 [Pelomonas sp. HMWF004]|nr:hypothetical protein DBR42_00660 [Pelomonas sp. HMWF004]
MSMHLKQAVAGLVLAAALPLAVAAGKSLNIPTTTQEHSEWCWAASSKAIINLFGTPPTQCAIVNWAYGLNYACGNSTFSWNSPANQPNYLYGQAGSMQDILKHWGYSTRAVQAASPWSGVVSDIDAGKPFVIRFGWTSGGGHIMVGKGYEVANNASYVLYMNPWPGEGASESLYSWVVSASDHKWTHTLRP